MGLMRALGRAASLAAAGAAAGYILRRRGFLGGEQVALQAPPQPPSEPLFVPQPETVAPEVRGEQAEPAEGVVEDPGELEPAGAEQEPAPEDAELVAVEPEEAPQEPEPDEPEPRDDDTRELPAVEADAALEPAAGELVEPPPEQREAADVIAVVDDLLAGGRPREGALADADVVGEDSRLDDAGLAEAVRVALAEEPGLLSAPIDIEVRAGLVTLRGELDRPEVIAAIERQARAVEGVRGLQSRLHLSGNRPPDPG